MPSVSEPTVFPSKNDIADVEFEGDHGTEKTLSDWMLTMSRQNHVLSGLGFGVTSGLNVYIGSGIANIDGKRVNVPHAENLTLTPTATNHIFLALSVDVDDLVDDVEIVVNTTGTVPAMSVKLYEVTTDATSVTDTVNRRQFSPLYYDTLRASNQRTLTTSVYPSWSDIASTSIIIPANFITSPRLCLAFATLTLETTSTNDTLYYFRVNLNGTASGTLEKVMIKGNISGGVGGWYNGYRFPLTLIGGALLSAGANTIKLQYANTTPPTGNLYLFDSNVFVVLL